MPRPAYRATPDPKKVARELKKIDPDLTKELAKNNQAALGPIVDDARRLAQADGGVRAKAATAIRGQRSAQRVAVVVSSATHPYALGAYFGAKRWKQFWDGNGPNWVGNDWPAGSPTEGPFDINPAVHAGLPELIESYGDSVRTLWEKAWRPGGTP